MTVENIGRLGLVWGGRGTCGKCGSDKRSVADIQIGPEETDTICFVCVVKLIEEDPSTFHYRLAERR